METSVITIADTHPKDVTLFPAIIINGSTGPNSSIYFYDDFVHEIRNNLAVDEDIVFPASGSVLRLANIPASIASVSGFAATLPFTFVQDTDFVVEKNKLRFNLVGGTNPDPSSTVSVTYTGSNVLVGEHHGNQLNLTTTLNIYTQSTLEREELVDQIYIYLRTLHADFVELGVEMRYVELGTPGTETIGTRVFHKQSLSVTTYSEWSIVKDIIASERISGINLTVDQEIVLFS